MLSPNDIAGKKFGKSGFGYRTDDVEIFLAEIAAQFSALNDEKEDLERKLEILADKLEEYRQDEDSLRIALLGAQKLGDGVIRESKNKAEILLRDATIKADKMISAAQLQIEQERNNLHKMQREVSSFKSRLLALYKQHLELISGLPELEEEGESESTVATAQAEPAPEAQITPEPTAEYEQQPAPEAFEEHEQDYSPDSPFVDEQQYEPDHSAFAGRVAPAADEPHLEPIGTEQMRLDIDPISADSDGDSGYDEPAPPPRQDAQSRFGPLKFGEGFGLSHNSDRRKR